MAKGKKSVSTKGKLKTRDTRREANTQQQSFGVLQPKKAPKPITISKNESM